MQKIVKYFNSLVANTLFKVRNIINNFFKNSSKVSNFNKIIISFISILFLYLFYLSIPTLYDKTWVQIYIEKKLFEEFRINFSTSSDISYNILPTPHFLIKDSKIFRKDNKKISSLSEIKNLKVFVSQRNFFNKETTSINRIVIDGANISLLKKDLTLLNNASNKQFSKKKIKIINSSIFFKDDLNETIAIIRIFKGILFFDNLKVLNLFNLKGEVFNIPFIFDLNNKIYSYKNKEINIKVNKLKLNIFNDSIQKNKDFISGSNTISINNLKIYTKYNIQENLIVFKSSNSKIKNSTFNYEGKLSINPFDLILDMKMENYSLSKLFNLDSIFGEFIKAKLLFNENISISSSIISTSLKQNKIFDLLKINFNILHGKINFDQTKIINKKIGQLNIKNSNLFLKEDVLFLSTDIFIDIHNSKNLFSLLQTNKKFRKPIKKIVINLDYNFLTNEVQVNNLKIDGNDASNDIYSIIDKFNDDKKNNLNNSRYILNNLLSSYAG
jgi:hypothetical protein